MVLKAQAGVEFVFILSIVIALSVFVLANGLREMELSIAIASVRSAGEQIALKNGVLLKSVPYVVNGNSITVTPVFSDNRNQERPQWIERIAESAKGVLAPNSQLSGNCFDTTRHFCIQ